MLRGFLPRIVLAALFLGGAYFAYCESVYLRDQSAEFGEVRIQLWMWLFRGVAGALICSGAAFLWSIALFILNRE